MDCIIIAIHKRGLGCHMGSYNFGMLMYADDLNLLSASMYQLQKMIDICIKEFESLDLTINIKKSACIRFGKRFNCECSNICVDGTSLPWSSNIKYLGIVFKSGFKFQVDFKTSRANFFRSFNAIYGKISKASEFVILSLVRSNCLPIILYNLEAYDLNVSTLRSLDNPLFLAVGKVFKSLDKNTVNNCMFYSNILPVRYNYYNRKIKFLNKLEKSESGLLACLFQVCGRFELVKLYDDLKITDFNDAAVRRSLWQHFADSLV